MKVDLNADMGESFGDWTMGSDAALLEVVTSANVACGYHAGDPDVMADTMTAAVGHGVGLGAHPGFPDLQGFGRRKIDMPAPTVANMVRYQLGAAQAMARAAGGTIRHLKLHGALANMAGADLALARACYQAALDVDPDLIIVVLAGTQQQVAAKELGARAACEVFADRAYNDDASLVDRRLPGAMIHDPPTAAERCLKMVQEGAVTSLSGRAIPTRIDTICVHGDGPEALAIARGVRDTLTAAGITLSPFEGASL